MDVGAGETDSRVLTGLSSDVAYSVSIVALAHLPSTVVGPVISRRQGDVLYAVSTIVLSGVHFYRCLCGAEGCCDPQRWSCDS